MDCKRALEATDGDLDKAMKILGEQGIATAEKKADRVTAQGLVESYIHAGGRIGVIVEVDLRDRLRRPHAGLQEPGARDRHAGRGDEPARRVRRRDSGRTSAEGRVDEVVLLKQPYIRTVPRTSAQLINETIGKTGENIQVKRFARFEIGE